ncbi:MAG: class IV adenylate cyclase [Anaerolineae bacterium]|nr:class IV adenylate cyclase [Anaerolineae bacterium]
MGQNHIESEAKIKVDDLAAIEQKLRDLDAELKAERVYERNVRYEDAGNTFTPAARVLRLRQDTRVRLTYKEPHDSANEKVWARTELEVTVSDFDTMDLLLQKLGYHPAWIYEKYRTTYERHGCEVVLDELPFGPFVEVEGEADAIERVLAELGLQDAARSTESYSDLFFRVKDQLKLAFRDLTFDNFRSIIVPANLFVR